MVAVAVSQNIVSCLPKQKH